MIIKEKEEEESKIKEKINLMFFGYFFKNFGFRKPFNININITNIKSILI